MIRVFIGYDPRESCGFHVFTESLIRNTKESIAITPLCDSQRDGTNAFTYARFFVPSLCDFKGMAIFADGSDMLMRADIAELAKLYDSRYAVQVVKHHYFTRHKRKYIGTEMEADNRDYPKKNWSSLILWNCEHPNNQILTADFIRQQSGAYLHRFGWLMDNHVGILWKDWNVLIGEDEIHPPAKIAHFTLGIPSIAYYRNCEYAEEWEATRKLADQSPTPAEALSAK